MTCAWWDDTWLNEGFATWFANVGVDNMKVQDWDTNWTLVGYVCLTLHILFAFILKRPYTGDQPLTWALDLTYTLFLHVAMILKRRNK